MARKKNSTWLIILTMVVSVALISLVGCESKSVLDETTTPAGTGVSVTASPQTIETGTTSIVQATVASNNAGIANQIVTFTVTPANAGFFTPAIDTTDANGVAASAFTGTTTGTATVSGTLADNTTTGATSMTVTDVAVVGSGNITMDLSETLLLANGEDTSHITIIVSNANGQLAPDGTLITLVAGERFIDLDSNGFWSQGYDELVHDANANGSWDAIGIIESTPVISGGTGSVTVDYISGNEASTVYLKATVTANGFAGDVERQIQLTPNATISSIYLASDSVNLSVMQTGGIETAMLYATGYDEFGNAVPEGLTIEFLITDGPSNGFPNDGEHLGNTMRGPYFAVTNSQGIASAPISSGIRSGTIKINAKAGTVLSNATQVMVSAGPPAYVVLAAEDCNVPYWYTVAEENPITAVVSDIYLNPVNDSTVVYFSTDEGTMKSHEARTGDLEGIVTTKWFSGNNVSSADGVVMIRAETSGGTVACTTFFYNSGYTTSITESGMPTSMVADGEEKATVYMSGFDINSNPVDGGVEFKAEANYVSVTGGTFEDGCVASSERIKITSKTLKVDRSTPGGNDDGIGAVDNVVFWSGTAFQSYSLTLTTGAAYSGSSKINGLTTAGAGDVVNLSATIADRWGNPLGDHTLNMTASGGTVSGASQETDAYGEANGFTWTADAGLGDFTITVNDTDPRGGIILSMKITVE